MANGLENQTIGRYIIDIDGCLRATHARFVSVDELISLHGKIDDDAVLVREINGEAIPLGRDERIELSEHVVGFFRSCAGRRLFRACTPVHGARLRWHAASALAA